jgi:hypothetical protein
MARIRSIKPAFFLNEEVAALPFEWRLLFAGLWTQADRAGRLEDRPLRLKAALFPYDNLDIEEGLTALAAARLIVRYTVGDKRLIAVPTWDKHQQPHVREAASELPGPGEHVLSTVPASGQHPRSGSGSGKGADPDPEGSSTRLLAAAEPVEDSPVLLTFPTVGTDGSEWRLRRCQVDEWQGLFPALDVLAEMRKALAWVMAHRDRRKTSKGMPKFLAGWLTRATDRPQGQRQPSAPAAHRPATRASASGDWWEECQRLHCGTCQKRWDHGMRMQAERAEAAS